LTNPIFPSILPTGLPGQCLRDTHPPDLLAAWLIDAGRRTRGLVEDLEDGQLLGPRLAIINPILWEVGHIAWFTERWVSRRLGAGSLRADADDLYDSASVAHSRRWDLDMPSWRDTLGYADGVREQALASLDRPMSVEDVYFFMLAIFHEDMHGEAFAYSRQTLGYSAPTFLLGESVIHQAGSHEGDVTIPGGRFLLGAMPGEAFVFDNEKWAHPVEVFPFRIARAPVTQAEFAAFVEADGYARREWWGNADWAWLQSQEVRAPLHWRRGARGWERRDFARWVPLEPDRPMIHVNWFEAEAYCRWAGRRLPTEVEWETACAGCLTPDRPTRHLGKRPMPWGDAPLSPERANLDGAMPCCVDAADCPEGDSAWGCRQMIGNVWEWTACDFQPYPGFAVDPYREYSQPWFGTHKVLRGGCWLTRARLLRNTLRNFYPPGRRDIWAGFRTCALP
jgi:gamma-glutamyl hercynylcysteine S-oxide synthase